MSMTKITVTSKRTTELSMKDQEQNFSQQEPGETVMKNACKLTRDQDLWSNLAPHISLNNYFQGPRNGLPRCILR